MKRFCFSLFWLAVCAGIALAQNPDNSVNEGARLFAQHCSACHGDTAKGGRGSDLTSGQWKHGGSDEEIVRNTIKGIPGTQMPAIPLSEADARKIIAFLRALARKAELEAMTGDVEAGRRLFFGAVKCSTCHMFGGRGDILAADLTAVRARQRVAEIAQRMQAPIKLVEGRFSNTHAPLAIDGKIIIGVTAGECALTGYVDAYDAATGKQHWRTYTTLQPGDPNRKTWEPETAADFGGAPTWMTGTYDANTKTLYWTTGNPGPDYDGTVRGGDNLYSCSVIALDPETGRMKWWFRCAKHVRLTPA